LSSEEVNCEVCSEKPWTELVHDRYTPHPIHMCDTCAENHENEANAGTLGV